MLVLSLIYRYIVTVFNVLVGASVYFLSPTAVTKLQLVRRQRGHLIRKRYEIGLWLINIDSHRWPKLWRGNTPGGASALITVFLCCGMEVALPLVTAHTGGIRQC